MLLENKGAGFRLRERTKVGQSGFTLVELLAISLVLTCMLFLVLPTLARAKQRTIEANCQSNLRQIGLALQAYTAANDDFLPGPAFELVSSCYDTSSTNQLAWFLAERMGAGRPSTVVKVAPLLLCPGQEPRGKALPATTPRASYALNQGNSADNGLLSAPFGRPTTPIAAPAKLSSITDRVSPAACFAMVDADKGDVNPTLAGWKDLPYQPIHDKIRNQLFFDWHVASKRW